MQGPQDDFRWVWEYQGPDSLRPRERIMIEEPLGPYERKLLLLNKGNSKDSSKLRPKPGAPREQMEIVDGVVGS
jgi:hypothetical protein